MAMASSLLGPPSLRHAAATGSTVATMTIPQESSQVGPTAGASQNNPVSEITNTIKTGFNFDDEKPIRGFTENISATFLTTGNPCLDFFFKVVPDTPAEKLIGLLEIAWAFNPLMALKLICNLRGVRGTGKSDKEGFYTAALWLHHMHPKTLSANVKAIAEFGYFKDFVEILYRILEGPSVREIQKEGRQTVRQRRFKRSRWNYHGIENRNYYVRENLNERDDRSRKRETPEDIKSDKEQARSLRKEKERNKAKKALEMYNGDEDYKLLHDSVAGFFEELLKADLEKLKSGKPNKISLAAKWCPTIDSSYDKATLICESIARKMFPKEKYPEYEGLEEGHYAYRVRDRLRKEVLVPLHKALELPEVYMSANKWDTLLYNRVPSVAMKKYRKLFSEHDRKRFDEYLYNVKSGKAKIAAGALLPHEIIAAVEDEGGRYVAELQWKRLVDDMKQKGKLSNCIAVSDVSGSMSGTPMEVSVALGILVSELSEEPWKGKLITFSEYPEIHKVHGESLLAKTKFVRKMRWGRSTNFQGVFNRILEVAIEEKLKDEQLVKRVFVFSDMEFNRASRNPWETDYQVIKGRFAANGYINVPEIVFWNLRDSRSIPVAGKQSGVALVSGFSKNLLNIFLNGGGIVNPVEIMELAIAGDEYMNLAVFD